MNYLLELDFNWADEIDFNDSCLLTSDEADKFNQAVEVFCTEKLCGSMYVGTNQEHEFVGNEIKDMYTIKSVGNNYKCQAKGNFVDQFLESIFEIVEEFEEIPIGKRAKKYYDAYKDKLKILTSTLEKIGLKYVCERSDDCKYYAVHLIDHDKSFEFIQTNGYYFNLKFNKHRMYLSNDELDEEKIFQELIYQKVEFPRVISEQYESLFNQVLTKIKTALEKHEALPEDKLDYKEIDFDLDRCLEWTSLYCLKKFKEDLDRYNYDPISGEKFEKQIEIYTERANKLYAIANVNAIKNMKAKILENFGSAEAFVNYAVSTNDTRYHTEYIIKKESK